MLEALQNLEGNILLWIQEYMRNDALTPVVVFITDLGKAGFIWIVLTLILLISKKTRKVGIMCVIALLIMFVVTNIILKNLVARPRPYDVIPNLVSLVPRMPDFSFPSGHTASSFAAGSVMFRKLPPKFGIPTLIFAIVMGLTRLYVGVHYPTDVLFGACEGIVIGYIAEYIVSDMGVRNKISNESSDVEK